MTLWKWSQVAATNATSDSTINWAEGQAPSSVNDSARAMMAAVAKFRDDIAGNIVTGGGSTSTAYLVSSFEIFDTLAHLHNQQIAFVPSITNAAGSPSVTLNVDSTGAKPLRVAPGIEMPAGVLRAGSPYVATYNNTDGAFYLQNALGAGGDVGQIVPFVIDPGTVICARGGTAVGTERYVEPDGSVYNISTFPSLGGKLLATYGGNGTTTFGTPDWKTAGKFLRHRTGTVTVGTAQTSANKSHTHFVSVNGTPTGTVTDSGHTHQYQDSSIMAGTSLTQTSNTAGGGDVLRTTLTGFANISFAGNNLNSTGTSNAGSADAAEARPEAFVVYYAIKT